MRAGLSTIQQTLTPEAASVLNHSIAEAGRRNHGQTTPLHVAATLLASPSGFLRQACIRSHPNSSHPLQCRALELCFSVALERLPTAQNTSPGVEPPISNALMAALKRAQAHQRRGCPEQQQQPLLAVKVELDQLIISILDDPSVSRVMREASFSSPAVKATIEQSLNSTSTTVNSGTIGIGFRPAPIPTPVPIPNRNLYLNPRLQQGSLGPPGQQRNEEVRRVIDILIRAKKRNPVLVGESEPEAVVKELLRKIGKGELGETPLNNAEVIPVGKELILNKSQIPIKIKELGALIETKIGGSNGGGVILDLGDLKWLVENPMNLGIPAAVGTQQHVVSEVGRLAVAEMGKLLVKFGDGSYNNRVWLVGTATCETYLRCQVYHPTMENDWDLQAVPIASRSPLPGMFPRLGNNGILRPLIEPLKSFPSATTPVTRPLSENLDPAGSITFCPQCSLGYEKELALLVAVDYDKSSSEKKSNSDSANKPSLPKWLQNAKLQSCDEQTKSKEQELFFKRKSQELQKRWNDTCLSLHPNYHQNLSTAALCNPNFLLGQPIQPKLQPSRTPGEALQLNSNGVEHSEGVCSPPGSPVKTDLVLGRAEIANENQTKLCGLDTDSFKKLLKGLMEQAWWQPEAASAVATTITRCKLGYGKRRGAGSKGDVWLLFTGPDRIGKRKMASVLAENYCGLSPIMICLGSRRGDVESDFNFRGKTALDRIAEAVRRNPFSVIVLEDIDEADMLIRGSIKKAMERGRLADSHGREISLGNVIFIVTGNWTSVEAKNMENQRNWRLRLTFGKKSSKRRASWLHDEERSMKERKEMRPGLSFDLNLRADAEADRTDGSHNSSDLTVEHEEEQALECRPLFSIASVPHELVNSADESIVFKPVDFKSVRAEIRSTITKSFSMVVDERFSMEVEDGVLEKIVGGLWNGEKSLEEWAQKVLVPNFQQLKARLPTNMQAFSGESMVVCLESDEDSDSDGLRDGDRLPVEITVAVGEVLVL